MHRFREARCVCDISSLCRPLGKFGHSCANIGESRTAAHRPRRSGEVTSFLMYVSHSAAIALSHLKRLICIGIPVKHGLIPRQITCISRLGRRLGTYRVALRAIAWYVMLVRFHAPLLIALLQKLLRNREKYSATPAPFHLGCGFERAFQVAPFDLMNSYCVEHARLVGEVPAAIAGTVEVPAPACTIAIASSARDLRWRLIPKPPSSSRLRDRRSCRVFSQLNEKLVGIFLNQIVQSPPAAWALSHLAEDIPLSMSAVTGHSSFSET